MPLAIGYLQIHAYVSDAQIPLADVAIAITDRSGSPIALRMTDRSGLLEKAVEIDVPEESAGQSPDTGIVPYAVVDIYARIKDYEGIYVKDIQIFPNVVTEQNLEMIPLPEFPQSWNTFEIFQTETQNL